MSSSSSDAESNWDESEDFDPGDDCLEEASSVHPLLERDIELFKQHYPLETVSCRFHHGIQEADIEISADIKNIKESILDAWGLTQELPLVLRLNLNYALYYYNKNVANVDVYQDVTKKQTGVLIQLKNIANAFCRKYYSHHGGNSAVTDSCENGNAATCTEGFLVQLYSNTQQRLQTLNDHCPICDKFHGATSMLKPTVCSNSLCVFSSQTMGVMCQVVDALSAQPEVVNLLIYFTFSAVMSPRHSLVLHPFPVLMDSETQEFLFSNLTYIKDLRRVMLILSNVGLLDISSEAELRDRLNLQHKHCFPMLRWIISSNRSHILFIPKDKQVSLMSSRYQFVLRNNPPTEDAKFRALKEKFGSCFAFHGSPLENWHSIVRQGLVVASGTQLQLNGAALGKGIYVTPLLNTALAYAGHRSKIGFDCTNGDYKGCVALCEVIMGPGLKKSKDKWIVQDSQYLCTRFFFVYRYGDAQTARVDSTSTEFLTCIKQILSEI